jgi:hypothetical protein
MTEEPEEAVDGIAEEQQAITEGVEAEVIEDVEKAKGEGTQPKRPWWKVWART